jgi:hypothetical protein
MTIGSSPEEISGSSMALSKRVLHITNVDFEEIKPQLKPSTGPIDS